MAWRWRTALTSVVVLLACLHSSCAAVLSKAKEREFVILNNTFIKDGQKLQVISGSFHYYRIPPPYWEDRLHRAKALGLNTIQTYVPWNLHEPSPGVYNWEGAADLTGYLDVAARLGLNVLLRAGPYICGEWDFGGLPWWLAYPAVHGGGKLHLRSTDSKYLDLVDQWWSVLLPRIAPYLYQNGGPILMVQVENEYGYCGSDAGYIKHLVRAARRILGDSVVLYTTDPPSLAANGSLPGDEVYTVVDFGPAADPKDSFKAQAALNPPGQSPPFCSEFYTGWITHFGEKMANTSAEELSSALAAVLHYGNGTGSVNLYMAHGGSNWGFWAGSGGENGQFLPQLTSYDYDAPISEAGASGQPGIGGPNKFQLIQDVISKHTGNPLPEVPAPLPAASYGRISFNESGSLLSALPSLYPGDGIPAFKPAYMESYGQPHGIIVYRKELPVGALIGGGTLDFGQPVHDYAQVLLDGKVVAALERSCPRQVQLPEVLVFFSQVTVLDIVVDAMGRQSGGCEWDVKGLVYPNVQLNGEVLYNWRVFPLHLDEPPVAALQQRQAHGASLDAAETRQLKGPSHSGASQPGPAVGSSDGLQQVRAGAEGTSPQRQVQAGARPGKAACIAWPEDGGLRKGPVVYRGHFSVEERVSKRTGYPADTFLDLSGWGKGLVWVNGFNLGWYWPLLGPQMTMYVPGPLLKVSGNEVVLLEFAQEASDVSAHLREAPDFSGPRPSTGQNASA